MKKKPFISLREAKEIAKSHPTPWYIYDEEGIIENANRLRQAFSWNEGFKEYFAVKATPNPFILKILKACGCGVDCASAAELRMAEACGFGPGEIMFSSNNTPVEEFGLADRLGAVINLDDITHIEGVEASCEKFPETMSCRYNPGGIFTLSNGIMDHPGEAKYGMTPRQIREAFLILRKKGVRRFGLHAFLASNTLGNEYYPKLAKILFKEALAIREETGIAPDFINLSGGIGIPYRPQEEANDILRIGEEVRRAYEEILLGSGMKGVRIFTELGRFMLGPYGALVTRAVHEKHIFKEYIGVDASAVNLMRPAMYGAYHHITVLGKEEEESDHRYDVVGSLCENNDKFAIDRDLPRIEKGDYLFIHDAGAHGYAMGYNYNGKLRSAELLLRKDRSVELIRRAERESDYFATFDFCDIMEKSRE